MKQTCLLALLAAFLLCSCGDGQKKFKIEGSFKGFNQGELYVYGLNGAQKLDTIGVSRGEFTYKADITEPTTLIVVFPNFSEIPVFAEPGVTITMEGDAVHLKETEVKGTNINKEMTAFRLKTSAMMPPGVKGTATQYIYERPESPICTYLLTKYFVMVPNPDYDNIQKLGNMIMKAQPDNKEVAALLKKLGALRAVKQGAHLPSFSAKGLKGETVSTADLNAKVNVISLWASWNYESMSIQGLLARLQRENPGKLKVVSISVDGSVKDCQQIVNRDSVRWSTVCDGRMWESPILQQLGMTYLPDNIVIDGQGKIVGRTLDYQKLNDKIKELIE